MTKKEVEDIIQILRKKYPDAKCSLDFNTPFELVVAVMLSAQCTDERVNLTTPNLFSVCKSVEDFANIDIKESRKYWQMDFLDNKVYLIPFLEGEAYVVDLDTGNAKICIKLNQLIHEREGGRYLVQSVRTMSDRLVIQTGSDCYIHEYDPLTEKIDSYCYEIRDEVYIKQYYEEATADKVREAEDMSRIFFLDKLQWISEYFVQKDDQGKSIGKDVYQVIKEMGNI